MAEKKLPPSEQRVRQAREKGQVGISKDLVGLAKLFVVSEIAFATEFLWREHVQQLLCAAIQTIGRARQSKMQVVGSILTETAVLFVAMLSLAAVISVAALLLQTRFNVATKAFDDGLEKLNPASNLKQLVSGQKLMMLVIGPIKVTVVLCVCYLQAKGALPTLLLMYHLSLLQGWTLSVQILHALMRSAVLALFALGAFDFALQRYMTWRKLRMDIDEVKREYKENEGDPHTKGHRKQIASQIRNEPATKAQPKPDAVVVNPEHIAIALAHDLLPGTLPRVLRKTAGEEAFRLREFAAREGIPVIRYVALARLLYATGREGRYIPSQTVRAVALVYGAVRELADQVLEPGDEFEIQPEMAEAMLPSVGPRLMPRQA
ncbi:type III secretion protein U [Variovorax boronicumulans]|uniref:EscU/YscU/HrcU family type III secretion system export apparatus switch protein n=1 Tax=Variovorax boronicumulans TaxID=436515 RepID=UPI00278751E2|nr:EscU/YscU/HrcU family type III secretion system export apparatus switch protein [Variovorax boronicumulans]MDQ0083805.1 type III secretion protein U [Variovorax boronicumulans]